MPTLTLTEVLGEPRQWSGKNGGTFDSYKVKAKDQQGIEKVYEINVKAGNPPPKLGADEFDITPPKEGTSFPPKIKRQFSGQSGGGRGRSPEETKAIQRQHSQGMAIQFAALYPSLSPQGTTSDVGNYQNDLRWIKELTDWFEADIGSGLGGGAPGPSTPPPVALSPAVESSAIASAGRKGATSKRFKAAGIDPDTQRRVVHAIAGDPPTEAGLDAVDAALANNDYYLLFDQQGIERPPELPDTADLRELVTDDGTIL